MDTVLFTDQGILVFVITGSIAVLLSVLGLATTHQTRADIEHQLKGAGFVIALLFAVLWNKLHRYQGPD